MARQIIDEHVLDTSPNALTKKFNINWLSLKPNSNCIPQEISIKAGLTIPTEADKTKPTEAELCLLICSLFPVGVRLPIEDLVIYGMALKMFEDVHNMIEGRYRVHGLIKIINFQLPPRYVNKLCVWEDKYGFQYVKVLYCADDLAKSIASQYQLEFGHEIVKRRWPIKNRFEYFYGLSLVLKSYNEHAINLEYLQLTLLLQHSEDSQRTPVGIFKGIEALSVLSHSLNALRNLRTLRLNIFKLEDMSWIGSLIHLELLSISTSCLSDVPKEMGMLSNLRLLDLRKMSIAHIPSGVLSRMLKLEELYLPLSFTRWGCRAKELDDYEEWEDDYDDKERIGSSINQINDEDRINSSISEIVSLSLHALQISIPKASVLPKKLSIFKNIQQFKISVPDNRKYKAFGECFSSNVLQLTGDAYDIKGSGICDLMSRTKDLNLTRVKNLKNDIYELGDYGFPQLEKMIISECDELEYVIDTTETQILSKDDYLFSKLESLHLSMLSNLKEIWHGRWIRLRWFENLSQISIRFCHKLKFVFPLSVVKGCALLKSIQILDCNEMKGVFYQDEENDDPLVRFFIEELDLHSLPKLVGFLVRNDTTIDWVSPGTDHLRTNEILSNSMARSRLKESCIDDDKLIFSPPHSTSREKLQQLVFNKQVSPIKNNDIISHTMYSAFSTKLVEKWLQNVKRIKIAFCDAVKVIFLFEENHVSTRAFNYLKELELYGLRNLMHIWSSVPSEITAFQNLELLVLSECQNLYLFSPPVAKLLVQLQKVIINRCEKMEEILKEDESERKNKIVFPQLKLFELQNMPNLRTFSSGIYPIELPLVESVIFNQCNKMEAFSYGSLSTPMLGKIQIDGRLYSILGDLNATIERTKSSDSSAASQLIEAYQHSQISTSRNSLNCGGSQTSQFSAANPNDTCCEPSSIISIPTTQGSVATSEANEVANLYGQILEGPNCMKEFTFADLKIATKNFHSDYLLGRGGFGKVYKGWLKENTFLPSKDSIGMAVAVKKLHYKSLQGFQEWQSEVNFLEMQSHPNVIKLLGYCWEDKELLLVYEFMQRGSLENHLFTRNEPLNWDMRIKVAIGAAQGLDFLHTSQVKVIHRDIKPANILLDGNYNVKISDFGLAKHGPLDGDSHVRTSVMGTYGYADTKHAARDPGLARLGPNLDGYSHVTTRVEGTYGFAAPEYVATGHLYVKSDVYSFGVVLLELMTGLRVIDKKRPMREQNLVDFLKPILSKKRKLRNVIDKRIEGQYSLKAMLLAAQLSLKCLESEPKHRPSMKEVVDALEQVEAIEGKRAQTTEAFERKRAGRHREGKLSLCFM